jgi:hypothetical protein
MKKLGMMLSLSILLVLLSFSPAFASGLELVDSYPKDGGGGFQPENVMVKLYFNEDVSAKEVQDINKDCFVFTDEEGKEIPLKVLYSSKNLDEIWVLVNQTLKPDSAYKLRISGNLQIPNGDTLGQDETVEFRTRNTSMDTTVNMGLMLLMVVGMLIFSSLSMKRNLKKQEAEKEDIKVNPYKVAKETGKSVEDIVAKTEKEKEKARANAAKKNKGKANASAKESAAQTKSVKDNKSVKGPKRISEAGSTYLTGRKEAAEKAAAKAAERAKATTTNPKNATGKSKNSKSKKK